MGRGYGILERYRADDADLLIVAFGAMVGTARVAVDALREAGQKVGLLKIKLFNPFPIRARAGGGGRGVPSWWSSSATVSPGIGGVLAQTLKSALYGMNDAPQVHSYLAGVGGVNVSADEDPGTGRARRWPTSRSPTRSGRGECV